MVTQNPYQQYKEQSLNTLAPGEILVKLYEQTIKMLNLSKISIERKDLAAANDALTKAQTIITTLESSLDMRFPISAELRNLYIYLAQQILKANLQKDTAIIDDCIPLVKDLRDSFEQADKLSRINARANVGGRAV